MEPCACPCKPGSRPACLPRPHPWSLLQQTRCRVSPPGPRAACPVVMAVVRHHTLAELAREHLRKKCSSPRSLPRPKPLPRSLEPAGSWDDPRCRGPRWTPRRGSVSASLPGLPDIAAPMVSPCVQPASLPTSLQKGGSSAPGVSGPRRPVPTPGDSPASVFHAAPRMVARQHLGRSRRARALPFSHQLRVFPGPCSALQAPRVVLGSDRKPACSRKRFAAGELAATWTRRTGLRELRTLPPSPCTGVQGCASGPAAVPCQPRPKAGRPCAAAVPGERRSRRLVVRVGTPHVVERPAPAGAALACALPSVSADPRCHGLRTEVRSPACRVVARRRCRSLQVGSPPPRYRANAREGGGGVHQRPVTVLSRGSRAPKRSRRSEQ